MSDIKRTRYFDQQLLILRDFTDEQSYHVEMRRRHNRLLHTTGIADGLDVTRTGVNEVTVKAGMALDNQGREVVLEADAKVDLSNATLYPPNSSMLIAIGYEQSETDPYASDTTQNTRIKEASSVVVINEASGTAPDNSAVQLARVTLDIKGGVDKVDLSVRKQAGSSALDNPDTALTVRSLRLSNPAFPNTQWPILTASGSNQVTINGQLTVMDALTAGSAEIKGPLIAENLSVARSNNSRGALFLASAGDFNHAIYNNFSNIDGEGSFDGANWNTGDGLNVRVGGGNAKKSALYIDGAGSVGLGNTGPGAKLHVSSPGFVSTIVESPNTVGTWLRLKNTSASGESWNIISSGSGNGEGSGKLLFKQGDAGPIRMILDNAGNIGIGTTNPAAKLDVEGNLLVSKNFNIYTRRGMLHMGTTDDSSAVGGELLGGIGFWGHNQSHGQISYRAGEGFELVDMSHDGPSLTYDLSTGNYPYADLKVNRLIADGGKTGYVVDHFINKLGEALEEGDVVVIGSNQISLYYGQNDNIPIPEVDHAQQAYDTAVCGIVCEVFGELKPRNGVGEPGSKSKGGRKKVRLTPKPFTMEEMKNVVRTEVHPNQIGSMVTLGAFAHCKVDADIAPIKAGDLLTTSPTKGHAQKALDPSKTTGAIIGKALGSLKKGQGKIPVMVMMQ